MCLSSVLPVTVLLASYWRESRLTWVTRLKIEEWHRKPKKRYVSTNVERTDRKQNKKKISKEEWGRSIKMYRTYVHLYRKEDIRFRKHVHYESKDESHCFEKSSSKQNAKLISQFEDAKNGACNLKFLKWSTQFKHPKMEHLPRWKIHFNCPSWTEAEPEN